MSGRLTRRGFLSTSAAVGIAALSGSPGVAAPRPARGNALPPALGVDASTPPPPPVTGQLRMGSATAGRAPSGETLAVNSQYLLRDGTPWLPSAGEFHYSRYPAELWESELRAIRAAGVRIVSSYVIWIHHEELQGRLSFADDLDIARFLTLCRDAGLAVIVRLGPWVHAEVRNGGLPDWVQNQSQVRTDDPAYLAFVTAFWTKLADRIRPLLWRSGGPVIGLQLENEYKGDPAHIETLKSIAVGLGLDVPLYTVTAWDGAKYPSYDVLPMFGGYQDLPWDTRTTEEPPNECYSFRFFSREGGEYGYPEDPGGPNSQSALAAYPFLTAEYGGGTASMYRRRVALSLPDDIAATMPVQLGSGVNLFGWYLLHGGRNPLGRTETLQESTATGSWNDLPVVDYDYQAPLGRNGEQRSSLRRIKLVHYFLEAFGSDLAAMTVRRPDTIATGASDLGTLRWSVRSDGHRGYLFVNNHVRQYRMADHRATRFAVRFAEATLTFPSRGVNIGDGAYFVWPLNLDLVGAQLAYATAQPVTWIDVDGERLYVFVAQDGSAPEFAFSRASVARVRAPGSRIDVDPAGRIVVSGLVPGFDTAMTVTTATGSRFSVLLLDQRTADQLWRITAGGVDTLLLTEHDVTTTPDGVTLSAAGLTRFRFATLRPVYSAAPDGRVGRFNTYTGAVAAAPPLSVSATLVHAAGIAPPVRLGGGSGGAVEPTDAVIDEFAARWTLDVSWPELATLPDAYLIIRYDGDLARLYSGDRLIEDQFYDGEPWTLSLKQLATRADTRQPLTLAVLPLRADAPVYLQPELKPPYDGNGQACVLRSVTATPIYRLDLSWRDDA
jgi:beta-galactosidase